MIDREMDPHLAGRLPGFRPRAEPERLTGGSLNHVWRVPGKPDPVIVKYAPPYVAASPGIPLDPSRILFEARALEAFGPGGPLEAVARPDARPPRRLDFDPDRHVLVMEDVGPAPHLGQQLEHAEKPEALAGAAGRFIGRLHASTRDRSDLRRRFDNRSVQQARLEVQYRPVAERLRLAGVPHWREAGARAVALGERFLEPGRCFTMGDLWPPSLLAADAGLRIIDWELCHFGRAAQDVGHLAAHLWMVARHAPSTAAAEGARRALGAFVRGYRSASSLETEEIRDAVAHAGGEILMRALGPFRSGSVYEGFEEGSDPVRGAVAGAVELLRHPEEDALFRALREEV